MKNNQRYLLFICLIFNIIFCFAQTGIITPKNNQIFNINEPIRISWNKQLIASTYKVQLSIDSTFSSQIFSITTSNTFYVTSINQIGVYYIRIKSINDVNWSNRIDIRIIDFNSITGLKAWFSADSMVNTTGNKVNYWTNIKDNSLVASQADINKSPYLENVCLLNNRPAITFNGNNYFDFNTLLNSTDFTMYMIRNLRVGDPTVQYVLGASPVAGFFAETAAANQGPGVFFPNLGINFFASETVRDTNYCMYVNTQSAVYRNYQRIANSSSVITNPNIARIGGRLDAPFNFTGSIAEFLYFDRVLDSTNNATVTQYFNRKYALPVDLGSDTILGTSFCDSVTISAGCYTSYLWSNGKTTKAIKVLPNNTYSVTVKDIFGQFSSDDIAVFPYKRLGNKTAVICSGNSLTVDLQTPPAFTVLWNDNTTNAVKSFNTTGTYTVRITDNRSCFIYDTINVIVDNPQLLPNPDASNNLRLCLNEKLFLQTQASFDSIRWSTGSSNMVIPVTAPGLYNVYGITTNGCVINKSFNVIIVGESPTARFGSTPICEATLVNFVDSTIVPSGNTIQSWKWNFSNNTSSTSQNTSVTFPAAGLASAALKVTTNAGCSDSIYKTFIINRKPSPSFFNLLSCAGVATTFVDQSVANAAAITNWNWDFAGLGTANGIRNPLFEFPSSGVYGVKLTATNSNSCSDTVTILTRVNASPVSNFSFDSVCGKTAVTLKFLATVESPSVIPDINWGSWDFGDGNIETAIRNPQHVYDTPGSYDVSLIVRSSDQCIDTVVKRIKVFDFPLVDFTVSQTQCAGKEIQFTDISVTSDGTPLTKWNWFFSGQATSEEQNPRYAFNAQGNYTVQLTARNAVGCTGTKLRSVAISAPPTPAFTFSPQNGLPPLTVNYFNQSPVNGNYLWDYGDGSPLVEGYNPPVHIYTEKGTFPIKLIATDFRGCTDTLTKLILVDKAFLDGVMASVSIIPNGEFYKIQVSVINNSNVEITALGLSLQLGGGAVIRENWTGSLLPGQTTVYLFTGEIKIGDNGQIPVICASIDNINNNAAEDRTDNNTSCKEVAVGSFDVLSVYPNPAYEVINFGVMLPKEGRVNIRFIDILGQQMYSKDFDGLKGYNSLSISTMQLNAAVYVAEVSYDGQVVRKKFMRKDRK
jgi:PKD repeat protein